MAPPACAAAKSSRTGSSTPKTFGMLHHDRRDVIGHRSAMPVEDLGFVPRSPAGGAQRLHGPRIDARGHQHPALRAGERHVHRLHEGGRAVVERGVGHLEAGELTDHRLVLEQHLEHALGELGLVRRVRGVELRTSRERPHDRGHVMVVGSAAREADEVVGAAGSGAPATRMSATSSISRTPSGIASGSVEPDRRRGSARRARRARTGPIAASISRISSSVCGANLTSASVRARYRR